MPHLLLGLSLLFALPGSGAVPTSATPDPEAISDTLPLPTRSGSPAALVLVRHGETAPDGTRDPALSAEGRERAAELAELLADAGVVEVWSTDLRRTRATAEPLARRVGLEVGLYDPFDPAPFRARLREARGTVVVVGHSNTTPAFVEALGGRAGPPIEEWEHDRIYILLPGEGARDSREGSDARDGSDGGEADGGGAVRTLRLRYGALSLPDMVRSGSSRASPSR